MFAQLTLPDIFIAMAGTLQVLGYLLINQTYLRLTLLCGTAFYIAYYFTVGDTPLWGAITISSLTICAILIGLTGLYARNARWAIPREHADLYAHFQSLPPGDFRKFVSAAQRYVITEDTEATRQGHVPTQLLYVISGQFSVRKGNNTFDVPGPTFVGEVAYLMDAPSAATTTLPAGTEVLAWSREKLGRASRQSPRFRTALEAVISRDLARKVSLAVSPDAERAE